MNIDIKESLNEFKHEKNIDRLTSVSIIESTFRNLIKKKYGDDSNFDLIINEKSGDFEIWQNKLIVDDGEVEDPNMEISITEARDIESDFELNEYLSIEVPLDSFDRRSILNARQLIKTKVIDSQKEDLVDRYVSFVGEIIKGEVYLIRRNEIVVLDDQGTEMVLPKSETINNEFFRKGERVSAIVKYVGMKDGSPLISLSRTDDLFLNRLLEMEVPQISDGLIEIVDVVRRPGLKAKVVVESMDDRIDPVGSIVGSKGYRIRGINQELCGESIDVVVFTKNDHLMVTRLFSGSTIDQIEILDDVIKIYVESDQIGSIIGKFGSNLELSSKIMGKEIEIYSNK